MGGNRPTGPAVVATADVELVPSGRPAVPPRFGGGLLGGLRFSHAREERWAQEQLPRQRLLIRIGASVCSLYQVNNFFTVDELDSQPAQGRYLLCSAVLLAVGLFALSFTLLPRARYVPLEILAIVCTLATSFALMLLLFLRKVDLDLYHVSNERAILALLSEPFFWLTQALIIVGFHAGALARARRSWTVTAGIYLTCVVHILLERGVPSAYVQRANVTTTAAAGAPREAWELLTEATSGAKPDWTIQWEAISVGFNLSAMFVLGAFAWLGQCLQERSQRLAFVRCLELEVANAALEAASGAQRREAEAQKARDRELAATVFHEVRNPLNGVVGHLRLAARSHDAAASASHDTGGGDGAGAGATEHVLGALGCAEVAIEFLNKLTHIEKLEAHAVVLQPAACRLAALLARAADVVRPQLQPGVRLELVQPPPALHVLVDGTVLTEVFINLLSNAAKHTARGAVSLECSPLGEQRYAFAVSDTGSGLSPEIKDSLFDRYRSIGGVGLGLHLTFGQIQSMGSTLRVVSPADPAAVEGAQGTRFTFELSLPDAEAPPRAAPASAAPAAAPSAAGPRLPEGLRVLIADDAKTNRKLLRVAFERHCSASWAVSEARSGEEAVALCEATPFDLVVMDEVFEQTQVRDASDSQRAMLGGEAIAAIRALEAADADRPRACIVSCTGHASFKRGSGPGGDAPHGEPGGEPGGEAYDLLWTKPFPDFTNGEMQRQLARVLAAQRPE